MRKRRAELPPQGQGLQGREPAEACTGVCRACSTRKSRVAIGRGDCQTLAPLVLMRVVRVGELHLLIPLRFVQPRILPFLCWSDNGSAKFPVMQTLFFSPDSDGLLHLSPCLCMGSIRDSRTWMKFAGVNILTVRQRLDAKDRRLGIVPCCTRCCRGWADFN